MPVNIGLRSGKRVITPGVDGLPFRGNSIPYLSRDPNRQPVEVMDAKIKILDLSLPEHLLEYEAIWTKIAMGLSELSYEDIQYNDATGSWKVLIRYGVKYMELPDKHSGRIDEAVKQDLDSAT